jgi:hypothetical protein
LLFYRCSTDEGNSNVTEGTLKEFYDYFDKINNDELHLNILAQEYYKSFGTNNQADINTALSKFQDAQKKGISMVLKKFPVGSIKFPFEQTALKQLTDVKSVYISGYAYPWPTAERLSFYITFEYNLKSSDFIYRTFRVEFYDTSDDIINACNVSIDKSGKTEIYLKPEQEFRKFRSLKIIDSKI